MLATAEKTVLTLPIAASIDGFAIGAAVAAEPDELDLDNLDQDGGGGGAAGGGTTTATTPASPAFKTIFELVEAATSMVLAGIPLQLVAESDFQGAFSGALSHRTTSRRRHNSSLAQDMAAHARAKAASAASPVDCTLVEATGEAAPEVGGDNGAKGLSPPPATASVDPSKAHRKQVDLSHLGPAPNSASWQSLQVDRETKVARWFLSGKPRGTGESRSQ